MLFEDDLSIKKLAVSRSFEWPNGHPGPCRLGFFFPRRGAGLYCSGSATQPFSAGDVLIVNLRPAGLLRPRGRNKLEMAFFAAFLEPLAGIFPRSQFCLLQTTLNDGSRHLFFPKNSPLAARCHELVNSAPASQDVEHRCHALRIVAQVFAEKYNALKAEHNLAGGNGRARPLQALSLEQIEASNCADLAKKYGYSQRHLNRLVHASFGLSLSALKMELRLLKAAALLRDGGTKVVSVATDCGFNHVNLFSSRFKKRFGASPTQWRKDLLGSDLKESRRGGRELCPLHRKGLCPFPSVQSELTPAISQRDEGREKSARNRRSTKRPGLAKSTVEASFSSGSELACTLKDSDPYGL